MEFTQVYFKQVCDTCTVQLLEYKHHMLDILAMTFNMMQDTSVVAIWY